MPQGVGDTSDIIWIPLKKGMENMQVVKKLAEYEMVPVDPFALAAHNAIEPDFATQRPNFTLWQDADGNWCYAAFNGWIGGRYVSVFQNDDHWSDDWWVAAVRKSALPSDV
jgi:hypothetical protein